MYMLSAWFHNRGSPLLSFTHIYHNRQCQYMLEIFVIVVNLLIHLIIEPFEGE